MNYGLKLLLLTLQITVLLAATNTPLLTVTAAIEINLSENIIC